MARMSPNLTDIQLKNRSRAEEKFYLACKNQLDPRYHVLYSTRWVSETLDSRPRDGETDFIIVDPLGGFIVVEVKGGGVGCDPERDEWYTIGRNNIKHVLDDSPFHQALREKKATIEKIKSHPKWNEYNLGYILAGHAVFFPDLDNTDFLEMPECPKEIIGGRQNLNNLPNWVNSVFTFWRGKLPITQPLGTKGVSVFDDIFCRPREVRPLVSAQLEEEEIKRIWLTDQQWRYLKAIGQRKRASICGGAGTGKTLLAKEKAIQLAKLGAETLLLCYNRPLADHLKFAIGREPHLFPMSFHQLCDWKYRIVKEQTGRDLYLEAQKAYPGKDFHNVHMPYALALSTEILPERYDAIIVDEGQDFGEDYWLPIEFLLSDQNESYLYVFYDQNQAIYKRVSSFPIKDPPLPLTFNCRNTKYIHDAAYHFYLGDPIDPPEIDGEPISTWPAKTPNAQVNKLKTLLIDLLVKEKVKPDQIAVLVASQSKHIQYEMAQQIPLPSGISWACETYRVPNTVLIDTVSRFKGMEADIIILWGIDDYDTNTDRETLYVAFSRAKSRLHIIGTESSCQRVMIAKWNNQPAK